MTKLSKLSVAILSIASLILARNVQLEKRRNSSNSRLGVKSVLFHTYIFVCRKIPVLSVQRLLGIKDKYHYLKFPDALAIAAVRFACSNATVNALRQVYNQRRVLKMKGPLIKGLSIENVKFDFSNESLPDSLWLTSGKSAGARVGSIPTLIYFHGGAYVWGSNAMYIDVFSKLLEDLEKRGVNIGILTVEYPFAPENPYPAGLDFCEKVYLQVAQSSEMVSVKNIMIGGDSAGGGLSLALISRILAKHNNLIPLGQLLFSPWVEHDLKQIPFIDECIVGPSLNEHTEHYVGNVVGVTAEHPEVSVINNRYLDDKCPPTYFSLGGRDSLFEQGLRMAQKLKAKGCDVRIDIGKNMPHVFPLLYPIFASSWDHDPFEPLLDFLKERFTS